MTASNRVIINTAILYGRMLITVGISLYSTRLILNALGKTDFGIFQLVGGVIAMLAFLNNALATSTQRFLSFHQGKNDLEKQKKIFTNSLMLHIILGLIIVFSLMSLESVLFDRFLNISEDRIYAAKVVYKTMLFSLLFGMIKVPFVGSLVANENMIWVAIVNFLETLLKLVIALFLITLNSDRLIIYSILIAALSFITFLLYTVYCFRKYNEVTFENLFKIEYQQIKELSSFAGWNLFGSLCVLGRTQGLAVLLNLFFGTVINAAYGIANQVNSQINFFSSTMLRALNPQIMKSEGVGDRNRMLKLSMIASKFGFFLFAIFAVPFIFEMSAILTLWLKNVPEYTVIFCQLVLTGALINQLTIGLQSAIQATGKIKVYQIVVGSFLLLNLPVSYLLLKLQYPAYSVFISYCFIEAIACSFRLFFLKKQAGLSITEYNKRVLLKILIPLVLIVGCCFFIKEFFDFQYRMFVTIISAAISFALAIYFLGLMQDEKVLINTFFLKLYNKLFISISKKNKSTS